MSHKQPTYGRICKLFSVDGGGGGFDSSELERLTAEKVDIPSLSLVRNA